MVLCLTKWEATRALPVEEEVAAVTGTSVADESGKERAPLLLRRLEENPVRRKKTELLLLLYGCLIMDHGDASGKVVHHKLTFLKFPLGLKLIKF